MGWWERRKQRRRERRELLERYREEERRLAALTPVELARSLESSDLAVHLQGAEPTKVAAEIARLSERDRYLVGLAGYYGHSTSDLAGRFFRDEKNVRDDLRRIFEHLRGEEMDVPPLPSAEADAVHRLSELRAQSGVGSGIEIYIPNERLRASDLPASDLPAVDADDPTYLADGTYQVFAYTFNGYQALGNACGPFANKARRRWQKRGELPATLTELRSCLFFERRRWTWTAAGSSDRPFATAYVRALVDAMRPIVGKDDVRST